jgi:hypothetical protein
MGPITTFFFTLQGIALHLNLIFLLISFVGGLYVAIHARNIPLWVRTPLWYLGLSSFIVAVSIILEFTVGPQFMLSYSRFGVIGEMLINFNIAVTSLIMLVNTVLKDVKNMKLRK